MNERARRDDGLNRRGQGSGARRPTTGGDRTYRATATAHAPAAPVSPRAARPAQRANPSVRNRVAAITAQWDFPLLAILAIMIAVGLVMVFSASYFRFGVNYFLRQVAWVGVGVLVMFITARIPSHWWQRLAIPIMIVALVGLAGVLVFGDDRFGARRTFFGSIQPSEFAKLAVVVYVSTWVASKGRLLADVRGGLIPFAILMGLVASLIVLEPNFSTAIVVLAIGIAIFFVGGADIKQLLVVGLIGILMFVLLLWQSPHAFDRIQGWWDMLGDPSLAPENIRHAIELMRRRDGLAADTSVWSQKLSVALLWSDYLFANIGADLGLIGQLAIVILYAALGYRCLGIALNAGDRFNALAAIGVTTWILVQAIMHIGTSIALIPATGQPLPFMSYGGSAMVASMAGIGLLLGIAHGSPEKKSVYASFAFGGRDRGTRVPDPGRGGRAEKDGRRRAR